MDGHGDSDDERVVIQMMKEISCFPSIHLVNLAKRLLGSQFF